MLEAKTCPSWFEQGALTSSWKDIWQPSPEVFLWHRKRKRAREIALVFVRELVMSQRAVSWIPTLSLSPFPFYTPLWNTFLTTVYWICSILEYWRLVFSFLQTQRWSLTRWAAVVGEERRAVIAVCRWRACGFCWLWKLLYVRGWTRRRTCARLWSCCLETLRLSRSHKLAWRQLGCGLRSPDPGVPQPLALQAT